MISGNLFRPSHDPIPCNATETECVSAAAVFGTWFAGVAVITCTTALIKHCFNKYFTHSNCSTKEKTKLVAAGIL